MNKYFIIYILVCCCLFPSHGFASHDDFPPVSIRGDKLFAGNEELLLKAIGYTGIRSGKDEKDPIPEKDVGYDLVDLDMKRIKEAGFNAIRTWSMLDEKIIELAAKHKLWVIGGIWTDRMIEVKNIPKRQLAEEYVARQAKIYSQYSNIAMLTILNEPDPNMFFEADAGELKAYFDSLVSAAHMNCPDIPVTFSNWPIAAFIDSASWDIVSYNLYSKASNDFKKVIDFYDYINGLKQLKSSTKPFLLSEYGFYSPVPELNPHDFWKFNHVKSEEEQAERLLEDLETISQTDISGFVTMQFLDVWFISRDFSSPGIPLLPSEENKRVHDSVCIEWGGIIGLDEKYEGIPRKAYYALKKANQAILRKPDSRQIYHKELPVRIHLENTVAKAEAFVDGNLVTAVERVSASWAELNIPVSSFSKTDKAIQHNLEIKFFDSHNKIIHTVARSFWTGPKIELPQINITHKLDNMEWPTFIITCMYPDGKPAADIKLDLAFLNAITWSDSSLSIRTDKNGQAQIISPDYGPLLMGVRYQHKKGDYHKNQTRLYFFKR